MRTYSLTYSVDVVYRYSLPGASKMTGVTVEPGNVIAKVLPLEPDAAAEEDAETKENTEEAEKAVPSVVVPEIEEWFHLQQTDRAISSLEASK